MPSTTENTLRKSAYVAVGAPVHLAKVLRERISSAREAIDQTRDRLSDEAAEAFDQWVDEGERLMSSLTEDFRERREDIEHRVERGRADLERRLEHGREEIEERIDKGRQDLADTVERGRETARETVRGVETSLTEPIVPVDAVNGIGPSTARTLAVAGVLSTRALVDRTRTHEARETLSEQTGIGTGSLEKWAAAADLTRIKGVGEESMTLLNALEIGTLDQMAAQDPSELHVRAEALRQDIGLVATVPSVETFSQWIAEAKKLS